MLNELKSKTQKLIQKQDKFESQFRKKADEFKEIKTKIHNLYLNLECNKDTVSQKKIMMENGINEGNVKLFLAEIETKIKVILHHFEIDNVYRLNVNNPLKQTNKLIIYL